MSNTPINTKIFDSAHNFKEIKLKDKNINGSKGSTRNSNSKHILLKQMTLSNSNNNYRNDIIERNHSSINIAQIKKYSKFRINKNEKNEKNLVGKYSTNKILQILKNSQKCKIVKKDSINEAFKKTEIESEPKKKRYDNFGNLINKQNKKFVHIIFKDQLSEMPITEEIQIECFKKYNFIVGMPKEGEFHPNKNPFYQCCLLY